MGGCARKEFPGVYSKVTTFIGWAVEEIEKAKSEFGGSMLFAMTNAMAKPTTTTATTTTTAATTTAVPDGGNPADPDLEKLGPVCPNSYRYIKCTRPGETLQIEDAFYGRVGGRHCDYRGPSQVNCAHENAKTVLSDACNGRRGCWVYVDIFAGSRDPCRWVSD